MNQAALAETPKTELKAAVLETVLLQGDLSKLDPAGRVSYMKTVCESLGLNPLTKPFEFISLNGKLVMYAKKDCTEQLRQLRGVSVTIVGREVVEGVYVVTARAQDRNGRHDESVGAVAIERLSGESRANAIMKAETKAKRRVTLSICGLGMLDETEAEELPGARPLYDPPPEPIDSELAQKLRASLDQEPRPPKGSAPPAGGSTAAVASAPASTSSAPLSKRPIAGGAKPAKEVPAKPTDSPSVQGQWTHIHQLREQIPGWAGDHKHPEHGYSVALRAYKKHDGTPCASGTDLTFDQAKNLIQRMQGLIDRKAEVFKGMEERTSSMSG